MKSLAINQVHQGDCLDLLPLIPDASVDMILCDLPYGITACDWDKVIDLDRLWEQYKRIVKPKAAIVLTASQPFTTDLINSNRKWFKYEWIWEKNRYCNFAQVRKSPGKIHENILVFSMANIPDNSKIPMIYNPQGVNKIGKKTVYKYGGKNAYMPGRKFKLKEGTAYENYPLSILKIESAFNTIHPTQKPVKLFEYLIRTYTDEGYLVLDNCIGSGTTAVAALNTGRNFIGIELSEEYCEIARKRIERECRQERLPLCETR